MKIIGVTALLVMAQFSGIHGARGQEKIVTIDTEKIISQYYKVKEAQQHYEEAQAAVAKELQDRIDSYQKLSDVIGKLNADIAKAGGNEELKKGKTRIRDQDLEEGKKVQEEVMALRTTRQRQIEEQFLSARSALAGDVTKAVETEVKSSHYDIVLDKSVTGANGLPVVLYSRDAVDLSAAVITALNKVRPGGASDVPAPQPAEDAPSPSPSPVQTHKKHGKTES